MFTSGADLVGIGGFTGRNWREFMSALGMRESVAHMGRRAWGLLMGRAGLVWGHFFILVFLNKYLRNESGSF
jgi:hypothetical protein